LRIYARAAEDSDIEGVLRRVGFTVISREEVFGLSQRDEPAPSPQPAGLRPATPQDDWALGELYRQAVPQLVRRTEELPFRRFATPGSGLAALGPIGEYVWVERDRIITYLGLCSSPKSHWLEVVVLPERHVDTLPYIRYMLTLSDRSPLVPVYCPVPDYGAGLGWVLRRLGFEAYARQVLLVAHTAARAPARRQVRGLSLERSAEMHTPVGHMCPEDCIQKP